ncbi:MAG: hypothetical protein CMH58_03920 [Myxococcales bacterium]|nr:hypothetical protein [Myxococcales bacterium]
MRNHILVLTTLFLISSPAQSSPGETRNTVTQRALNTALTGSQRMDCISCHVSGQVIAAVGAAETSGFTVNEGQANRLLGYAWSQQQGDGAVYHGGSSYPIEVSAWVGLALSYYTENSSLDFRESNFQRVSDYLLSIQNGDGGLPENDHTSGVISLPTRTLPTMGGLMAWRWQFEATGENRYLPALARAGEWFANYQPVDRTGDGGLIETAYSLTGMAAAGRTARDPIVAERRDWLINRMVNETCWGKNPGASCDAWTTGTVGIALLDAGLPFGHPAIRNSVRWLLDQNGGSGWWPRPDFFSADESVSTNPVIYLSRIPVFYISHLDPENGSQFTQADGRVTISTDGISEEGRDYELTLYVDNVQVASSQDAAIEYVWNLQGVRDGLHYIRVEGRDAEGYEDSRESVVLVGDYVGLLSGVSPNPFNPGETEASVEFEVVGMDPAHVVIGIHATKDDDTGVPRQAGRPCTEENAATVCVTEGSVCEPSEGEEISRCSGDSMVRSLFNNEATLPGIHNRSWNGHDDQGNRLDDGVYLLSYSARRGEDQSTDSVLVGVLSEAPAEVRGMVRDRDTDRGIPGSVVELRTPRGGLIQKGQVGRRGNYVLPLIRPGSYQLTANVPGYGDPDGVGLDLGSGELRTIHFWMSGNQPPSFRPVDPVGAIPEGSDFELRIQAVDLDGDPITLEASVPIGGRFDDLGNGVGRFRWQVPFGDDHEARLLVEASDGLGRSELLIRLPIAETNRPPVIHGTTQASLNFGQQIRRRIWADDPDGDGVDLRVENMPQGAQFDGEFFQWTAPRGWMGRIDMEVVATDDGDPVAESNAPFLIAVGPANGRPVLEPVRQLRVTVGQAFNHQFIADDPDGDALTFGARNLPEGLAMDPQGLLQGLVPSSRADSQAVATIWVRDSSVPEGLDQMEVTLLFIAADREPYITLPEELVVSPNTLFRHPVDFGGGQDLSLVVLMGPPGLAVDPQGSTLVWSVPSMLADRTVLVLGLRGAERPVRAQTILVKQENDRPPRIVLPAEVTMDALQVMLDASESMDPEGAPLLFEWYPEPGATLEDSTAEGRARFRFEKNKRYKIVLRVSDGTHAVSRDVQVLPEAMDTGSVPSQGCFDASGSAGSGLFILLALFLLRGRRKAWNAVAAFLLLVGCGSGLPHSETAELPKPASLLPGLLNVSAPSPDHLVQVKGEPGSGIPLAEVSVLPENGEGSTTSVDLDGSFETYVLASNAEDLTLTQSIDGQTSEAITVKAGVRPPTGRVELARDAADQTVLTLSTATNGSQDDLWIRDPYGSWQKLPAPDAAGRFVIPTEAGLPPSPGDGYELKQVVDGVSSAPRPLFVSEPPGKNGFSMTTNRDPEDDHVYLSGPAISDRSSAFILVTNLDKEGFPQRSAQAEADGRFGPIAMPGKHGDRMVIEVIGDNESRYDVMAPLDRRRTRSSYTDGGTGRATGSPGSARPGAEIEVRVPRRGRTFRTTADEHGAFDLEFIVGAGETILLTQSKTSDDGSAVYESPPIRLESPKEAEAIRGDLLRSSRGEDGSLRLIGLAGSTEAGALVSTQHAPSGSSSEDDLAAAGATTAAEDGSFDLAILAADVRGGDELLITSQTVRPTVYLVPTTVTEVEVEGADRGGLVFSTAPGSDQSSVALAPGTLPAGVTYTLEVGDLDLDRNFTPKGSSLGGFGSGSGGRWALTVGPDGGSGSRPVQVKPGDAIQIVGANDDESRQIITEVMGLRTDQIGVSAPDEQGRVDVFSPPGAAPVGATVRAQARNGGTSNILVDSDGGFGLRVAAESGDSILVYVDHPGCDCSSLPTTVVVPGGDEPTMTLPTPPTQLLATWRRTGGYIVYGAPMATVPGATVLMRHPDGRVFTGQANSRGSFLISAEGEPGDLVELTAQRGQARSEAAQFCVPEVAQDSGVALTMCAQDWQLSGRARLGEPGTTMTWTLTSMDPQRAVAAQLLLNGAPGLVPWRRRAGETLAVTHAPPVTSMFSNHTEPLNLGRSAWIGPVGETSLLLLDFEAIPFQNPQHTLQLGLGLGAQRRWRQPELVTGNGSGGLQLAQLPTGNDRLLLRTVGPLSTLPISMGPTVGPSPTFPTEGWEFSWEPGVDHMELWGGGLTEGDLIIAHYATTERYDLFASEMVERPPLEEGGEPGPTEARVRVQLRSEWIDQEAPEPVHLALIRAGRVSEPVPLWLDDNDGVPVAVEQGEGRSRFDDGPRDTDRDGIPDLADHDSDNDGIEDREEYGQPEEGEPIRDSDEDGTPDYLDEDSDGDGIPDQEEGAGDQDNDGTPDHRDIDADNDGIPDEQERGPGEFAQDSDQDGIPDFQDTDSDNDGVTDQVEIGADPGQPANEGGAGPDYLNPCYPRAPQPLTVVSLSGLPGQLALPQGFGENATEAVMATAHALVDDDCTRPDPGNPRVLRPVGTRITSDNGHLAGAVIRRHRPIFLDAEPVWRRAAAHLEDLVARLQGNGWSFEGPGPRAYQKAEGNAAFVQLRATPPDGDTSSLNHRLNDVLNTVLQDCDAVDDEEAEPQCTNPGVTLREGSPAGVETQNIELAISALDRCEGSVDFQIMMAAKDQGEENERLLHAAIASAIAGGSHVGSSGATLSSVCRDFTYGQGPGALDVIVVVDNSGSMVEEQQALAEAADDLTNTLSGSGLNWRVGVTTTDANPNISGGDGQLVGGFTRSTDSIQNTIRNVGIDGSGREYGLRAVRRALERATADDRHDDNASALRPGVPVAIILLTDSEDQAARDARCDNRDGNRDGLVDDNDCIDDAVESTIALLNGELDRVPLPEGLDRVGTLFAITTSPIDGCPDRESFGWSQRAVALATGGSVGSICSNDLDYSALIRRMAAQAADTVPNYDVGNGIIAASLHVNRGDEGDRQTPSADSYRHDPVSGQVILDAAALPGAGGQVGISGIRWSR